MERDAVAQRAADLCRATFARVLLAEFDIATTLDSTLALVRKRAQRRGIAPEDLEAVFEEFRRVGSASKKIEGAGLGLAISRKFIELHGGRISATSQAVGGSTFAFALPRK